MTPKQFRTLRHQLGLSQAGLAESLKVNVRQIKRWEAGDSPVSRPVELAMQYLRAANAGLICYSSSTR